MTQRCPASRLLKAMLVEVYVAQDSRHYTDQEHKHS